MANSASDDYYAEHKKMLAGEPYTGGDPYLTLLRKHAQERVAEVAKHRHDPERYAPAIRNLLGSVGDDKDIIESPTYFDYEKNTHVGKRFFMNSMCVILNVARVDIGYDVLFGFSVKNTVLLIQLT
ncbi:hypothetical protein COEREDRAFT_9353 [Coemansia reversa NRRL 1564]|uniref:Maltose/galactoside acetyltransferase domain-containing protein n=1 Tax=Coemansia reversa (strain ATCC 12441 / NRRL 1564) TaxID=763665 RepID=A0A2G5B8V7_COERN|nr:hypothetical protein COEREDRAFT_9353 [Coemansia reversa NRRL 1564]|eukprot:PIA15412.1 hypothetical protein COEREDRAFT_9353 [Coemansia reversa NRRL 1564]